MNEFFRYPSIKHLAWLAAGTPRDEKILSPEEVAHLLSSEVRIEEKVDGANLGFSLGPDGALKVQNRGQYLSRPFTGQFARLDDWMQAHQDQIIEGISPSTIVFGEWCAARHSLDYDRLPDWWLMFDVYDRREGKFWSSSRRDALATSMNLTAILCRHQGKMTINQLQRFLDSLPSCYRDGPVEGVVIKAEEGGWMTQRAKLVRSDFTQSIEDHWRSRSLQWNRVRY